MAIYLEYPTKIRISEDTLLFDAIVICTVTRTVDSYRSMGATEIKNYKIGKQRKTDGQEVSKNIVPILYKSDLDKEAEVFLARYYSEALEKPTPVPSLTCLRPKIKQKTAYP